MLRGRNGLLGVKEWEDFREEKEIKKKQVLEQKMAISIVFKV